MTLPTVPSSTPALRKAVCGGAIAGWKATISAEYRGEQIYFCRLACRQVFETDPDRFVRGEIDHPQEES
jgi:YHS domain-containing protein